MYDIALETISHGDGRVDPESLANFVTAYQTVTALKLGELWAIPIMLRLALMENLRRVGTRVTADRIDRNHADSWADQMTEVAVTIQTYRVKIFDGEYEVLQKRTFLLAVDLASASMSGILYSQLVTLTRQAALANEPMDAPRLELWDGNVKVLDWA